jgi:hypothetical protein
MYEFTEVALETFLPRLPRVPLSRSTNWATPSAPATVGAIDAVGLHYLWLRRLKWIYISL